MKTFQTILICSALAATLSACGSAAKTVAAAAKTGTASSDASSAKLTDEAAAAATTDATTTAESNDAAGDDATVAADAELPAFLDVVKQARDYTRKLLGIDDSALKTFKAEVEAARALSNSPEEFQSNIASAQTEFKTAMDAQKTAADAARVANKVALDAIYAGTVQVFLACGTDVAIGQHDEQGQDERGPGRPGDERGGKKGGKRPPPPPRGDKGGKGPRPDDNGEQQGQDQGEEGSGDVAQGSSDSPRMMFGNGEFSGNFSSFMGHFGKGKLGLADSAAASTECTTAVSALQVLITPAS